MISIVDSHRTASRAARSGSFGARPPILPRPRVARIASASEVTGVDAQAPAAADVRLAADLIQDDEIIILLCRPSPLYIPLSCLSSVAAIAMVSLFLAYLSRWQPGWFPWTDTGAFALGTLLVLMRLGWQALEWYSRIYVLTDRRIIRRMGVLRVAVFETSLRNIQHTSVFRRLRERGCGLGTIGFATAGSDVFEALWVMIAEPFTVHKIVVDAIKRYGK